MTSFNSYQNDAMRTAIYPEDQGIVYTALGLASEAGEVAGKIKKTIRDHGGVFDSTRRDAVAAELSDVLWYVAALSRDLGYSLEAIACMNLAKLEERSRRGTLGGSGDYR